jgi:hypothetical protein
MELVELREELKNARTDAKIYRTRLELTAIEAAGGTKRYGESAEVRERKLVLLGADDPECCRLDRVAANLESQVARMEARWDRANRVLTFFQWQVRNRLTDTLDRLANRPCNTQMDHLLENVLAEATGDKGVYAGESDWIETRRVG